MTTAFVLHHVRSDDEHSDDTKLIGVYSSETNIQAAIERLKSKPGFVEHSAGFEIRPYPLDKDHWEEGFAFAC